MRALLDVNVLIALMDRDHVSHAYATEWLESYLEAGWASCPITQNGCVRIMSQTGYPNPLPVASVIDRLRSAASTRYHMFWADDLSVLDGKRITPDRLLSSRQITDAYLLALAVRNEGCFVTFDRGVPVSAVNGARDEHLLVL